MPALHSFAFGQYEGEWLLIGGRVDGLHRRQPFAAFDSVGHNYELTVVNPTTQQVWTADLKSLPIPLQEQLSATNPEFLQVDDQLFLAGGYGYSPTLGDHKTFEYLTVVDIPAAIQAVKNKTDLAPAFQYFEDARFAVTGGQMERIGDVFYLVGGQNFGGRYNPNGPDFGPGFFQKYNHEIRTFRMEQDGFSRAPFLYSGPIDSVNLHRRDFNMCPQIMPDGREGLLAFSGVFQYKADIPYLNLVEIEGNGYRVVPGFQQHYQQYHCAKLPLYDAQTKAMHTLFLGGISQYGDSAGAHFIDCNVPFVKTIARVTRDAAGQYQEYRLPIEMPDYLGASAEFIRLPTLPQYENGVIKLDELPTKNTLIGYVVGGIHSSDDNIFWVNEGDHSSASSTVYKVFLSKSAAAPADFCNLHSTNPLQLEVLPDPYKGLLTLDFINPSLGDVRVVVTNAKGKTVLEKKYAAMAAGPQHLALDCKKLKKTGRFILTLQTHREMLSLKMVVEL
jgi:hypothetical protein